MTGGKHGHGPTNNGSHLQEEHRRGFHDPTSKLYAARFDQPEGAKNREKGGNRPKDRQRACLERVMRWELEGADTLESLPSNAKMSLAKLKREHPIGIIRSMFSLRIVAEDFGHKDFMNAQRLVREILTKLQGHKDDDQMKPEPDSITVTVGRLNVPLPGADSDDPAPPEGGSGSAGAEGAVNAPLSTEKPAG